MLKIWIFISLVSGQVTVRKRVELILRAKFNFGPRWSQAPEIDLLRHIFSRVFLKFKFLGFISPQTDQNCSAIFIS